MGVLIAAAILLAACTSAGAGNPDRRSAIEQPNQQQPVVQPVVPERYDLYSEIEQYQSVRRRTNFLVPPKDRTEIGRMLEALGGFHVGVELGVQTGGFAHQTLSTWPSCTKYYAVDLWAQQKNYVDFANVNDEQHDQFFKDTQSKLSAWTSKVVYVRNYTSAAANIVPDELDFVYVDARHDYCGAREDILLWWPKLRPGGILAGHDYRSAAEVAPAQDWSLCMDGQRNKGAVMGAVNEFAMQHGLTLAITWSPDEWRTWLLRKPSHGRPASDKRL